MSAKKKTSGYAPANAGFVRWRRGFFFFVVVALTASLLIVGPPLALADEVTGVPPTTTPPPAEATVVPPASANEPASPTTPPAKVQAVQPIPVDPSLMEARVSYQGGAGMIKGKKDSDWSYASINAVVAPGDSLWVDKQGTMEVEIAQGTYLRLADGSKAEVRSLTPAVDLRGTVGSFFVQRMKYSTGDVTFETPVGKIHVAPNSDVRVDILGSGSTTVSTRWGQAVIHAPGGEDVTVAQGQRSYVDPGYLPSVPAAFNKSTEDPFDTWNRIRGRAIVASLEKLPENAGIPETTLGAADLSDYGNWVDYNGQTYWHPNVDGYVPYRDGYWDYLPDNGYCWVDNYPFAYTTSHYGRWLYDPDAYGWLWDWQPGWGLGWCATLSCGPDFMWCPLNPWNEPCWGFGDSFWLGGCQFGFGCCSYCGIDDLQFGRCHVHGFDRGVFDRYRGDFGIFGLNGRGGHFFHDPGLRVHDFMPNRFLRGPERLAGFRHDAGMHVARLEQGQHFSGGVNAITHGGVRSPIASNIRTAQVSPGILSNTRQIAERQITGLRSPISSRGIMPGAMGRQNVAAGRLGANTLTGPHGAAGINAGRVPTLNSRSPSAPISRGVNTPGTFSHVRPPAASSPAGRFPIASGSLPRSSGLMQGPQSFRYAQPHSFNGSVGRAPFSSGSGFRSTPAPAFHSAPAPSFRSGAPAFGGGGFRGGAPAPSFHSAPAFSGGGFRGGAPAPSFHSVPAFGGGGFRGGNFGGGAFHSSGGGFGGGGFHGSSFGGGGFHSGSSFGGGGFHSGGGFGGGGFHGGGGFGGGGFHGGGGFGGGHGGGGGHR